jgi:MFS transporter, DHA3 family, macrolide efflux protein
MLELLRIRHFRNLWLGQIISRIGDAFYFIGPLFVVKKVFDDSAMVGYVAAVEALPFLLLGPFAGALADRIDRKKIMVWSDLLSALLLFAYLAYLFSLPGHPPRWPFFVAGFLLASIRVFFMPAKGASVPRLVPPDKLMNANAFSASSDQFAWLIGIMLVALLGVVAEHTGIMNFFRVMVLINALSFVWSVAYLFLLPPIIPERESVEGVHVFTDVVEGVKYAKTDKVIGLSLLATIGLGLFMSPFFVVYLETNKVWFGGHAAPLSIIEGCFIVGMLMMNFIIPKLKLTKPGMVYGVGLAVAGVNVILMGFSPLYPAYCLWNFFCGIAIGIVNVPMMTYQQLKVPDAYLGRIMSLGQLIWMSVQPIGNAVGGPLLAMFGIVKMHAFMGAGFAVTGAAPLLNKEFREAILPEVPSSDEGAEEPLVSPEVTTES